jgi:hypothetical protein
MNASKGVAMNPLVLGLAAASLVLAVAACGGGGAESAGPVPSVAVEADPASKSCGDFRLSGDYPPIKVEVVEGNVPCRAALRVMQDHYHSRDTGSWSCHGPEGLSGCEKNPGAPSGETIRGRFYCRDWETDRAACLNTFGSP